MAFFAWVAADLMNRTNKPTTFGKRITRSGFLRPCVLFGLGLGSIGLFFGLVAFGSIRESALTSRSGEDDRSSDASIEIAPHVLVDAPIAIPTVAGLVAAYGFDEGSGTNVTDASGNGNTGTVSGSVTWTN